MKIFLILLLTSFFSYPMAQVGNIKVGNKDFKTILFSDNLTIYRSSCENRDDYLFASKSVILYDSITKIDLLGSYNYVDIFYCQEEIDTLIIEQIETLLSVKNNRIAILYSMEDKNKEFIAVLLLFKKKKFKKFAKRANKLVTRSFAGEKILVREFKYDKYAKEFILAKTANRLSLISVHL